MADARRTVLILGAGINGCALARELALNGLSVVLVDTADVASGATSYSSRLIHGGLRYLEYGEFDLVRESLAERGRLLRLAPQFVRPLELFVPIRHRLTGLWTSIRRFLGWDPGAEGNHDRGLWLVRAGLWFYDAYARDATLPKHRILAADSEATADAHLTASAVPPVDAARYRWLAAYYDAQVEFPERFTLALLADACQAARDLGGDVRVLTYHEAHLAGRVVEIRPVGNSSAVAETIEPAAIVNATGAWVDHTLARLPVPAPRLIGGTKGSHILTSRPDLVAALAGRGIYAEAADGRPFFILPLAGMTLIGTTDEPYEGDPYQAVASRAEVDYLLASVREVFPQIAITRSDIALSYSGVRPLPFVDAATPGAITRRHAIRRHSDAPLPLFSLIGGKLTTCRQLAEEAAEEILDALGERPTATSRDRVIPGGEDYPLSAAALLAAWSELAGEFALPRESIEAAWRLCGTRTREVLAAEPADRGQLLADTPLPLAVARWAIRHQWAVRLGDLVERRLMLLYKEPLTRRTLDQLAKLLVAEGRMAAGNMTDQIDRTVERLKKHFHKGVMS